MKNGGKKMEPGNQSSEKINMNMSIFSLWKQAVRVLTM